MPFYPEDKEPKDGLPVYNSSGEQRNITDPRYKYHDGLENTTKAQVSSTDDIFYTTDAALARAEQLGCNGYHELTYQGDTVYVPCDTSAYYDIRKEQFDSALNFTYIGNYRILSWDSPFKKVSSFNGWNIATSVISEDGVILDTQDISIDFRYSIDGKTWSLWQKVGTVLDGLTPDENSNHMAELNSISLDPTNDFYPELRFTSVLRNDDGSIIYNSGEPIDPAITILDVELDLEYDNTATSSDTDPVIKKPNIKCTDEKTDRPVVFQDDNFTFDPYAINQGINLYKDLSKIVNKVFGFEVNYYSLQPNARGKDVFLKEYTLFNVVDEKCIKIMVPENQFPDSKVNYDPFGVQFEDPFEVHIDRAYFEEIFGRNSQPRKRDIIYFPLTNRIYEINSTYLYRDFMYSPVYYKIELKKYSPKSNTYFNDPAHKEELESIGRSTEELFGEEIAEQESKELNPKQYEAVSQRMSEDPNRDYLYENLENIAYDLNNNWTIVFNNYYDLDTSFIEDSEFPYEPDRYREAVRYKESPILESGGEWAYSSWFNLRNFYGETKLVTRAYTPISVSIDSVANDQILYSTYPYEHKLEAFQKYSSNPEGYVSIEGDNKHTGGFKVLQVVDKYRFTTIDDGRGTPTDTLGWRMQKSQARNLLSGTYDDNGTEKGIHLDIIHSGIPEPNVTNFIGKGAVYLKINDLEIYSKLQFDLDIDSWYGIVVNVSNKYKQVSIHIWEMSYDPTNPQEQSSKLNLVHEYIRQIDTEYTFEAPDDIEDDHGNPRWGTNNNAYKIYTSPLYLSNIRVYKKMIDIDRQSTILNQNTLRDEHLAYIVDNAKPQIKARRIARNR